MNFDDCVAYWERKAKIPVCHVNIGFVQETDQWTTGKPVEVSEITCHTMGDSACRYRVHIVE